MAKNQRQLNGWSYQLESDAPSAEVQVRRSRRTRGMNDDRLVLKRDDDGLELKVGSCMLCSLGTEAEVGLIKSLSYGIDDFIEMTVMWFYKSTSVDKTKLGEDSIDDNEIFITALQDKVYVEDVISAANVISATELETITIDESNKGTTFVCKRGCNESGTVFSDKIDWREVNNMTRQDALAVFNYVKELTAEKLAKATTAKQSSISPKKLKTKRKSYKESESEDEVEADDSASEVGDLSSDSDYPMNDSDAEAVSTPSRVKRNVKRSQSLSKSGTPQKRKSRGTPSTTPRKKLKKQEQDLPSLPKSTLNFGDVLGNEEDEYLAMNSTAVFKQARKKLTANAKLKSLPCRDKEFNQLFYSLQDAVDSQIGTCIYVSGTPGTGKTATVREVVKQLADSYVGANKDEAFDYVEINGLKLLSPQASYEQLWEKISGKKVSAVAAAGTLDEYFNKKDFTRKPLVVLMDELDQIVTKSQTIMYNFFNWPTYENSKLIVIAVANTMDLPERMLSNKISSRLGLKRLQFPGYDYKQLSEIIKHRLVDLERLNSGKLIIKKDAIEFAARKVASVSGDARRALIICRRAIEIAEWENYKASQDKQDKAHLSEEFTVAIVHIMKAVNETTNSPVTQFLQSLSFVSKLFLASLLSRKRKSGLAENGVDGIVEEMNNSIAMRASSYLNKNLAKEGIDLVKMLYGPTGEQLRIRGFKYVLQELLESGIMLASNEKGERLMTVKLNISDDEVINVLRKDENLHGICGF